MMNELLLRTVFTGIASLMVLFPRWTSAEEKPPTVVVLNEAGDVIRISLAEGVVEARRSFEEVYYARTHHVYADPKNGAWVFLEGGMGEGEARPASALFFLHPDTLEPISKWVPPQNPLGIDTYGGTVIIPPDGRRIYYQSIHPVYGWLFEIDPTTRQGVHSWNDIFVYQRSLFVANSHAFFLVKPDVSKDAKNGFRLFDISQNKVDGPVKWPTNFNQLTSAGMAADPVGGGFMALAINETAKPDLDHSVALLRINPEKDEFGIVIENLRDLLPDMGRFMSDDEHHLLLSPDARYLVCRSQPDSIHILDLQTRDMKSVALESYATRSGWHFGYYAGPYMFPRSNKMVYPLIEDHYVEKSRATRLPWGAEQTTALDLLIIDLPTATIERVIHVPKCRGFRDLAIMGSPE